MRPETRSPLSLEEHRELGQEVRATALRLAQLATLVRSVYGPNNQAAFGFARVVEDIERLRGDLQAQAAADLPGFAVEGFY